MESEAECDAVTRDLLLQTLRKALSPNSELMKTAEGHLKALEVLEGTFSS
jgi:hypothetical protein